MKKLCKALALILCMTMLLPTLTVLGDSSGNNVLTLEEAKKIALENDTQYKLQQLNIEDANESYDNTYDDSRRLLTTSGSVADRAKSEINRQITIESAAIGVRKEVFKRKNIERTSNSAVTKAYYDVLTAAYGLDDKKNDIDIKKKDLDIAKIKLEQGLITKNSYTITENSYRSAQTAYNKAFADYQNYMQTLSTSIGQHLDPFNDKLDMAVQMPDIKAIDLNKIKVDFMKNCDDPRYGMFFSLKEQVDLAEYKLNLTQEKYDYYSERNPNKSSAIIKQLDDMIYRAQGGYDSARYSLEDQEKALDVTLQSLYIGLNTTAETVENLKKSVEDTRISIDQNKIRFELGLISDQEMKKSEISLKGLENQLNTAIINYSLQYSTLTQYSDPEEAKK